MSVGVERAQGEAARTAVANMLQLYIHDFADFMAPERRGRLDENGLFAGYPLDAYFIRPDRVPLLIREQGRLVGFALLDRESHTGAPLDRNMGEFFIARGHRRGGTGTAAAHAIFAAYPGRWEVAVARRNLPALAFWRRVVGDWAGTGQLSEVDMDTPIWNGPVIRFTASADSRETRT